MPNYSTKQVSEMLGISARAVRFAAERLGVGEKVGRDWIFTGSDLELLKQRETKAGRKRARVEEKEIADE